MIRIGLVALSFLVYCCLLAGCGSIIRNDVPGTYKLDYGRVNGTAPGTETLVLKPDSTFDQHFKPAHGKGWTNKGRWRLQDADRVHMSKDIFLEHRLDPLDAEDRVSSHPDDSTGAYGIWKSGSTMVIEVEPDNPWRYEKVK